MGSPARGQLTSSFFNRNSISILGQTKSPDLGPGTAMGSFSTDVEVTRHRGILHALCSDILIIA